MQIEKELAKLSPKKDMLLTIGVFDGVHVGHKHLISQLREHAKQQSLLSGVVTFRRHPQEVLSPQSKLPYLTNLAQRTALLKEEGIDAIVTLSFTPELAQLSARQFIGLLQKYLRMRGLVVGPDFALGKNREGNINNLRTLGQDMKFSVTVVPPLVANGKVVSSTASRKALADGDMKTVSNLLGRFFSLSGKIITGASRGAELGFPTANIDINSEQALPTDGVYTSRAYIGNKPYQSVTNIGKRPTFDGKERTVEVYILNSPGDLYGHRLRIDIVERLRGEKRFNTIEELKKQIAEDVKQSRAILNSLFQEAQLIS